jgi:alanine racemase
MSDTSPTRPNWMEIDLAALDHNYRLVRSMLPEHTRIHASVKSSAYGLQVSEVAKRLVALGADALSAGSFNDALAIRAAGIDIDIIMLGGTLPAGIPAYLEQRLIPTIHNFTLADAVSSAASVPIRVYVKIDCGWGRLGIPIKDAKAFVLSVARLPRIQIEGLYTHLPFFDAAGRQWAQDRTTRFDELVASLRREGLIIPVTQARSSAGIITNIADSCSAVSPGSILYGKAPLPQELADSSKFQPVLKSVRTQLIHVSPSAAERTSGLHSRFAFQVSGATGVVPFGRADGNRAATVGQVAHMIVRGIKCPVLGVSSEMAVVDLSQVTNPEIGEEVTILGENMGEIITLADLAKWQGTGMNDVLLMMNGRMPRVIIG